MPATAKRATDAFHGVESIPNGAALDVKATVTAGIVQGHAVFTSDQIHQWTYDDLRQGAQATIDGFCLLRMRSELGANAAVRVDVKIINNGETIRHRFWELAGGANGESFNHGLSIDAGGN